MENYILSNQDKSPQHFSCQNVRTLTSWEDGKIMLRDARRVMNAKN